MDRVSKKTRGRIMAAIRSKWTGPERFAHNLLKGHKVRHKMHPDLPGHPDILVGRKAAIFIDGCFWHGHKCSRIPDIGFWVRKIGTNKKRDRRSGRTLRKMGYRVKRIWECRLSSAHLLAAAEAV